MTQIELERPNLSKKIDIGKYLVSLWRHSSSIEGVYRYAGRKFLEEMLDELFEEDGLFEDFTEQKKRIKEELQQYYYRPLPLKEISSFVQDNPEYASMFYDDACSFANSNVKITHREKRFLDNLSRELRMLDLEKRIINRKYFIH